MRLAQNNEHVSCDCPGVCLASRHPSLCMCPPYLHTLQHGELYPIWDPVRWHQALTVFLIEELLHPLSEDHLLAQSVGIIFIYGARHWAMRVAPAQS